MVLLITGEIFSDEYIHFGWGDTETMANLTEDSNTAGVDAVYQENFLVLLEVYLEDVYGSGNYVKIAVLHNIPDENDLSNSNNLFEK